MATTNEVAQDGNSPAISTKRRRRPVTISRSHSHFLRFNSLIRGFGKLIQIEVGMNSPSVDAICGPHKRWSSIPQAITT